MTTLEPPSAPSPSAYAQRMANIMTRNMGKLCGSPLKTEKQTSAEDITRQEQVKIGEELLDMCDQKPLPLQEIGEKVKEMIMPHLLNKDFEMPKKIFHQSKKKIMDINPKRL